MVDCLQVAILAISSKIVVSIHLIFIFAVTFIGRVKQVKIDSQSEVGGADLFKFAIFYK